MAVDRWNALRSRLPRPDPLVADGLLALVAAGLALAELQSFPSPQDRSPLNITLVLLQTLPLAFRRRAPFTVRPASMYGCRIVRSAAAFLVVRSIS